jgi:hypothetical protein
MTDIAEKKMNELPGAEKYHKASAAMKKLTEIEKVFDKDKKEWKRELNKDELTFLYEIDSSIEGFGYQRDSRIEEIRNQRSTKDDMLVIFECSQDQIAENADEVNEKTQAYLGIWNMDIFQKIRQYPNIKHLYESFPDKKIFMQTLETDPSVSSPALAEAALKGKNIYLSDWGKDILYKTKFSKESQIYELVRFTVEQLGFSSGATTDQIYQKAQGFGLELCPAEVGPHFRLQYLGKEWMLIAMKQIADRHGDPIVFSLYWYGGRLELDGSYALPGGRWDPDLGFVFRFRKKES